MERAIVYTLLVDYFRANRMVASRWVGIVGMSFLLVTESAWEHTWIEVTAFFAGIVLVGVATIGRLWCSVYISGYKNVALITVGPYSVTRHPLYFFSAMGFVGLALSTETLLPALLVALLLAVFTPPVMAQEERHLAITFGKAFADYAARTPQFWPRLSSYNEPDVWTVRPHILRRRLTDSLWFAWGVGIIELVEALHELHVLPTLVHLY